MKWKKLKTHLTHWANELEDYGNFAEAKYIRHELLPMLDKHVIEYNQRGKKNLLALIEKHEQNK